MSPEERHLVRVVGFVKPLAVLTTPLLVSNPRRACIDRQYISYDWEWSRAWWILNTLW